MKNNQLFKTEQEKQAYSEWLTSEEYYKSEEYKNELDIKAKAFEHALKKGEVNE